MTQRRKAAKAQRNQTGPSATEPSVNDIAASNKIKLDFKNPRQRYHARSLKDNQLTVVLGPAGTGKTYVAMAFAAQGLLRGEFKKLVLMRPAVALEGEQHGFMPGGIWKKVAPWARPMLRKLARFLGSPEKVFALFKAGKIELLPFTTLRGDEFEEGTFVMLDEAQNCTPGQIRAFLTRIADGTKIMIAGDETQHDHKDRKGVPVENGLEHLAFMVDHYKLPCGMIEYLVKDVARGALCAAVVAAYQDYDRLEEEEEALLELMEVEAQGYA